MKEIVKTDIGYIVYNVSLWNILDLLVIRRRKSLDGVYQDFDKAVGASKGNLITEIKTFNWL